MEMSNGEVIKFPKELAAALVEAQTAVEAVTKHGYNKQIGKDYATADDIAAVASKALNEAGAGLVRVGNDLDECKLANFDLGNQAYAGDVVDTWLLVHRESEAAYRFTVRGAVIVSKGRPHDKGISATQTYGSGVVARGVLAMEREEKGNAVDAREDADDGQPMRRQQDRGRFTKDEIGPRCSGSSWLGDLGRANDERVLAIAQHEDMPAGEVWAQVLANASVDLERYRRVTGEIPNAPDKLGKDDGKSVEKATKHWLGELSRG